ncbi:hypothetical protein FOPG_18018 [Fusarium oxysporum f. sp. conglutinans race 2 54008]|uniref:ubiquitinyl hydrolase 1 n=1 Tax=Fusarium oxysporum f. sp. conglutinans race 2 54008 TaxID=1089457 RepID=X0H0Y8_FUSOX|nr:hypothetical protein FOPG_18018 [Fusarium oxysporum f. sp. conglutinans race 2 54008]
MTLTCLSYYYGGLDEEALFSAFSILTKSDNARVEYHEWTGTAPNLPLSFRALRGVNLRDRVQFKEEIYPHLCFPKSAIDYYLSHLVSSKEAKKFPHKLSVSGGDLAKTTGNPTTGFSGTNDSRYVLPMDIKQLDFPEFAKPWLARYQDDDKTQAVVCFNEDDEAILLDRSGKVEELETPPFAEQTDRCLSFLDESHTRGTYLKLPPQTIAQ